MATRGASTTATDPGLLASYADGPGRDVSLDLLGRRLDEISWQDLEEEHAALAGALQEVVNGGYSPQQIRQYTLQRGLPMEWARWLEAAARYLGEGEG